MDKRLDHAEYVTGHMSMSIYVNKLKMGQRRLSVEIKDISDKFDDIDKRLSSLEDWKDEADAKLDELEKAFGLKKIKSDN
jgi:hypothetical protein